MNEFEEKERERQYNERMNPPNPDPNRWWLHRRIHSYAAMIFGFLQTILLGVLAYYNESAIMALGAVIGWSYSMVIFIIGSYFSNAIVTDYMDRK